MKKLLSGTLLVTILFSAMYALPAPDGKKLLEPKEIQSRYLTLKGQLDEKDKAKSAPTHPQPPVQVLQTGTALEVFFLSDLGVLNITVVNIQGYPVYQTTVNAVSGNILTIGTSSWASGDYVIMITNGQGGCLEGEFSID